jgi:hypothetical protein
MQCGSTPTGAWERIACVLIPSLVYPETESQSEHMLCVRCPICSSSRRSPSVTGRTLRTLRPPASHVVPPRA